MKFLDHHNELRLGVLEEACFTLSYSRDRMIHCLKQLDQTQLWWRPFPEMNAAGNIVLHVCGNLRQWLIVGLGNDGQSDQRDRPNEFALTDGMAPDEAIEKLVTTVEKAQTVIGQQTENDLLRSRTIQGFSVTGLGALWHSVSHLEGHAQEMIYLTRLQLGKQYEFKDQY